jgi:ubiquinol-cytochrome c reductase subunit 7
VCAVFAGLKLDDVRNEWHPDVQTAISRLSPEELSNRNKRLKRAMDLSLKHSELNKDAQAAVQPLVGYLPLDRAREERLERCFFFSLSHLCLSVSLVGGVVMVFV